MDAVEGLDDPVEEVSLKSYFDVLSFRTELFIFGSTYYLPKTRYKNMWHLMQFKYVLMTMS